MSSKLLYHPNDYLTGGDMLRPQIDFSNSPTCVQSQFQHHCDIGSIISRFTRDGNLEHVNSAKAFFGDISALPHDYGDFVDFSDQVNDNFMNLPSDIRSKFGHDPVSFYEYVTDPSNREDALEKGYVLENESLSVFQGNSVDSKSHVDSDE